MLEKSFLLNNSAHAHGAQITSTGCCRVEHLNVGTWNSIICSSRKVHLPRLHAPLKCFNRTAGGDKYLRGVPVDHAMFPGHRTENTPVASCSFLQSCDAFSAPNKKLCNSVRMCVFWPPLINPCSDCVKSCQSTCNGGDLKHYHDCTGASWNPPLIIYFLIY